MPGHRIEIDQLYDLGIAAHDEVSGGLGSRVAQRRHRAFDRPAGGKVNDQRVRLARWELSAVVG